MTARSIPGVPGMRATIGSLRRRRRSMRRASAANGVVDGKFASGRCAGPARTPDRPIAGYLACGKAVDQSHAENGGSSPLRPGCANSSKFISAKPRSKSSVLNECFELLGQAAKAKPCKGMQGIVEEGEEVIRRAQQKEDAAADLALIGAAQRVEHYEISGYTTARNLAHQLRHTAIVALLSKSLAEEENADQLFNQVARSLMSVAKMPAANRTIGDRARLGCRIKRMSRSGPSNETASSRRAWSKSERGQKKKKQQNMKTGKHY